MNDNRTSPNRAAPRSESVRTVVRLTALARGLRVAGAMSSLVVLVLACVAGAAVVDAVVRFPSLIRVVILGVIVFFVAVDLRRFVIPALRFRPRPVDLALRIERMRPELRGRLASAVEFELSGTASESELAARAVRDADERALGSSLAKVIRMRPTAMRVFAAIFALAAVAAASVFDPASVSIAARRVLTPWSDAAWPARTSIESLVKAGSVAPRGKPVALRAKLVRGDADRERVHAEYRVVRDGVKSDWIKVALARQPSGEFERMVDADGDAVEFRFVTSDAATDFGAVRLVAPPTVVSAEVQIDAPEYARAMVKPITASLGDCSGSRGILRDAVLEGSRVGFDLHLSRAIPFDAARSPIKRVNSGDAATDADATIEVDPQDGAHWHISCTANKPTRLALELIDADGIQRDEPVVLAFDTVADRAPTATIAEPVQDESIVADAKIEMRAETRDDIGLKAAGIEIATRIGKDAVDSLVFEEPAKLAPTEVAVDATCERTLDVSKLKLSAGDSVLLRGYAEDFYVGAAQSSAGPATHGRVRSAPRILRIVGEDEFERQIRSVFAGVRRDAMRVDERQAKARDAMERDPTDRAVTESQAAVSEGTARMREAITQAMQRLERNGRKQGVLSELSDQARDLASTAESRSAEASTAIERAQQQADPAKRAEAAREAEARQDAVRQELEDLVALLDRDEDAWLARRRLDALANKIRQSARETDQAARRSNGESREELSPDARAEVDAMADKQQQAAAEAEKVISELKERAQALKEADPQQSRALDAAAKAAEEGKVREEMEQAAKDSQQNRLAQSKQAQDRAAAALSKAAEALAEDHKVRAQELARQLESLADSIRRLIEAADVVRGQVDAVGDDAAADADRERFALGAGKLAQNTRGVAADARSAGREAARAARALDAAATGLGKVTSNLRAKKFDRADTLALADAAIVSLNDALKQAEEAANRAEQRAEQEKREELLVKYRDFLERQAAMRASVGKIVPADGKPLGRRELIESRRLGTAQEELRKAIADMRTAEKDVQESDALVEMHDAIDSALVDAKENLSGGRPTEAVPQEDDAIASLSAIVEALDESSKPKDEDEFGEKQDEGDQQQQGSGQSQSAGAVPPAAEIKLLRTMQESLAKRTRSFAEGAAQLDVTTRAQKLAEIAARQQRILELGSKIADKIAPKQQNGATMRPTERPEQDGGKDAPKPSEPSEPSKPSKPNNPTKPEGATDTAGDQRNSAGSGVAPR